MSYSIFTTDVKTDIDLILRLQSFFKQYFLLEDFVIFTDEIGYALADHSVLSTFYMVGYRGSMIFLTLEDYLEYKDTITGHKILYLDKNTLLDFIDRSIIKDCSIVVETNNQLEWIKNHELQQTV